MRPGVHGGQSGFTMIELLVAVAVSAILVTALYATFFSVFAAADASGAGLDRRIETGRLVDRFSRDIRSAMFKSGHAASRFTGGGDGMHSAVSMATHTRPVVSAGLPSSDLTGIRYFVADGEGGLSVFREARDLFRDEAAAAELLTGVESFEVLYYNGKDWAKAWDSDLEGALPVAVRMKLVLTDGERVSAVARVMLR